MLGRPLVRPCQDGSRCCRFGYCSKANINATEEADWTALMFACQESHDVVELIKAARKDPAYLPKNVHEILRASWREGRWILMESSCLGVLAMGGGTQCSTLGL